MEKHGEVEIEVFAFESMQVGTVPAKLLTRQARPEDSKVKDQELEIQMHSPPLP